MSNISLHEEKCPKCGKEQMVERYDSINDYHRELFPKIVDKSIFDYTCKACKEKIHSPYPLLFHKMGIRDIQIGYRMPVMDLSLFPTTPLLTAMKKAMADAGDESEDVSECYNDEDEFAKRVERFVN